MTVNMSYFLYYLFWIIRQSIWHISSTFLLVLPLNYGGKKMWLIVQKTIIQNTISECVSYIISQTVCSCEMLWHGIVWYSCGSCVCIFVCHHYNVRILYDSGYLTCSKKLTGSQLSLPHGINRKLKCETKNKMMSVIRPVRSRYREAVR